MTWFGHDTIKSMKIGCKISRQVNDKLLSKFAEQLRNTDWNYMYVGLRTAINKSDPNLAYENFAHIYKEIYNKIFTKFEKCASRHSPKKPWMTTELLKSCLNKDKLYIKYRKLPSKANKEQFVAYRN